MKHPFIEKSSGDILCARREVQQPARTIDMAWAHVIRSSDREMFKRCRRAWDLGSRSRQNYEPALPVHAFDFDKAIHDALALYYFPGMWEWDRAVVMPTVLEGFFKSMDKQRNNCLKARALSAQEEEDWNDHLDLGESMLENYFEWAPTVDDFEPLKVASDFEVNIPDPARPGRDLGAPGNSPVLPVRYRGRSDVLVMDGYDAYWIIDHRISETWLDLDQLLLDEQGSAACWAWQNFNLGMKVAGVIYNELRKAALEEPRLPVPPARSVLTPQDAKKRRPALVQHRGLYKQAIREPEHRIEQRGNAYFRRTAIARSQTEIENAGRQIALEAMEITNPALRIYPTLAWEACSDCAFRRPCMAMNEDTDAGAIIEASYRKRPDDEFESGRLGGSTWSFDRGGKPPDFWGKE